MQLFCMYNEIGTTERAVATRVPTPYVTWLPGAKAVCLRWSRPQHSGPVDQMPVVHFSSTAQLSKKIVGAPDRIHTLWGRKS